MILRMKQKRKMKNAKIRMEEHNQFIAQERKFVNHQRFLANSADDGFYMEIDGMDQSKTNLPHWPNMPKNINKDRLMQIHVTGVRYSGGRKNDVYVYLYTNTFAHDSACTCTIIYESITKVIHLDRLPIIDMLKG